MSRLQFLLLACLVGLILLPSPASAFGAGNIASISSIEGKNWRHGDIEDMLKTVAFLRGHKWTSMQLKRVYFGNWLRDYSQAVDVGTLKGVQADTIRILVWVLAFMSFGYATQEFEVSAERLGVYRPEEHIDNPKDYADNIDATQLDPRLRGPVMREELAIDPDTGMKNYIANERGGWATSSAYVKWSFSRSMHFGRLYTHGAQRGRQEDLCEALRCLGQGLHCLEDFGAHTNYTELALRELGYREVFALVGEQTGISLGGKQVFPLVTGTFGGVDFLHSLLGEATDHVTQSEIEQMDKTLTEAANAQHAGTRGTDAASRASSLTNALTLVPGMQGLAQEAVELQAASDAQAAANLREASSTTYDSPYAPYNDEYNKTRADQSSIPSFQAPPGSQGGPPGSGLPGLKPQIDPEAAIAKIYPILVFRDKVVRSIASIVSRIPGLEKAIETIMEKITLFVFSLLAPYVKPLIAAASNALKQGSGTVVAASAKQQYLVWTDPTSTDPTHSMLSKDHFSNILNDPAGKVATVILQYVAPRVIYGWDNPDVPEAEILADISRVFHHPALRDGNLEIHRTMFEVVEKWARATGQSVDLNVVLSSESVRAGRNHQVQSVGESLHGLQGELQAHGVAPGGPLAGVMGSARRDVTRDFESDRDVEGYGDGDPYTQAPGQGYAQQQDAQAYAQGYGQGYAMQTASVSGYGQNQDLAYGASYPPQEQGQQYAQPYGQPYQGYQDIGQGGGYGQGE